jgi:N-methylhydantoinase B
LGVPWERDPAEVLEDVIDEFISLEKARDVYGVVVEVGDAEALDYRIDEEATRALRGRLADKPRTEGFGPWEVHPYGKLLTFD